MRDGRVLRVRAFRGIDQSADDAFLESCDTRDAQNMDTEGGGLRVAKGFSKWCGERLPGAVRALMQSHRRQEPNAGTHVWAATDEGLYRWTGAAWALEAGGAFASGGVLSYLNYQKGDNDLLLLADGLRAMKWDGKSVEAWNVPAAFGQIALHVERVWGSAIASEPDTVYWSQSFDPDSWENKPDMPEAGGGFVLIPTWNGGTIIE